MTIISLDCTGENTNARTIAANSAANELFNVAMAFCRECGEEIRKHTFIQLESLKESFSYTIPSFPVFQVKIKHIKFSFLNDVMCTMASYRMLLLES